MNEGRTLFAQLMDELLKYEFDKCVRRYGGNHHVRSLPTHEQVLVMAFAKLTYRESLRDIETCLRAVSAKLYHSGIRQPTAPMMPKFHARKPKGKVTGGAGRINLERRRVVCG